ncbi:hypothetical protein BV25DRAFT_1918235 [Artomyces pyxidatus]|uniref:Uncharacterized protein n=1 Tax=Artomyces pyxidatus TaxID=48021 RepID=A0ACB8SUL5_9AGAM|nr:hypothetical protein BV25DRAFT_1918235 [Artomyces pyxidatus]
MLILLLFACGFLVQVGGGSSIDSPTTSTPHNGTILEFAFTSTDTCTDIAICRTRYTIVWSSLLTIFACVWTAIHRNVPQPERADESQFWRSVGQAWEATKIVVVTVLVPEWVLAWAFRQQLNAWQVRKELEWARNRGRQEIPRWIDWKRRERLVEKRRRLAMTASDEGDGLQKEDVIVLPAATSSSGGESEGGQSAFDMVEVNKQTGRLDGEWKTRHGFAVVMGGFHYYKDGEPQHPLSRDDVVELVMSGDLVPPTNEEIRNWSQSDVLSKGLAITQTLWFVTQAIARHIEGLAISQLELVTLAYTTITVGMYLAWWHKPQNVGGPVRIAVRKLPEPASPVEEDAWYIRSFAVIAGWQDNLADLRKERRVPTFYGGGTNNVSNSIYSDALALFAAGTFGAIHCAAWHYTFPSHAEQFIWRASSFAITVLPDAMLFPIVLHKSNIVVAWGGVIPFIFALCAPIYIAARLLLLALSFTTLRSLPPEAYRAIEWTTQIPHAT